MFIRTEVNWQERIISLRPNETKSGKRKSGTIPEKYWPWIREWEERNRKQFPKADYLFHLDGERLTTDQIDEAFNSTCEVLGWHAEARDDQGNVIRRKNRTPKYDRSACRWHDSRRTATTTVSSLENLTDADRRRTLGISAETQARYDQTQSALKVRDALDRKLGVEAQPPTNNGNGTDKKAKLQELKAWFDGGLIDGEDYKREKNRILAS